MSYFILFIAVLFAMMALSFYTTIMEGGVGVVTRFGRYQRILLPGFNWIMPWERSKTISLQNRSLILEFEAITLDQANVYFNCMLLYSVADNLEETIKRAVFSFASEAEFDLSLRKLMEDETRLSKFINLEAVSRSRFMDLKRLGND